MKNKSNKKNKFLKNNKKDIKCKYIKVNYIESME